MELQNLSNVELIRHYSGCIKEMKRRGLLRTKNVIGELGAYMAIDLFSSTAGLPKLQATPVGTENVNAISNRGERYSIKSTSGNVTGVFYGLQPKGSDKPDTKCFEYVLICKFDEDYCLEAIYQLTWDKFIEHKRWHSRMNAWNLSLSKALIADAEVIYRKDQ